MANTPSIKIPGMEGASIRQAPAQRQRIIYSIEGHTKTQKSSFGLWGPGPLMVFDIDHRLERVVEPFEDGTRTGFPKTIVRHYIEVPEIEPMSRKVNETARKAAQTEWDRYVALYGTALESSLKQGGVRTIVQDDITELYDLRLISEFGRTQGIQQRDRGAANFDFLKLIDMGKDYNANVVWVSKVKEEWAGVKGRDAQGNETIDNKATGNFIPDGYKRLRQTVQVALRAQINQKRKFEIEVLASGLNADTNNKKYTAEDWGKYGPFAWVSFEQQDDTIPEDWISGV